MIIYKATRQNLSNVGVGGPSGGMTPADWTNYFSNLPLAKLHCETDNGSKIAWSKKNGRHCSPDLLSHSYCIEQINVIEKAVIKP